MKILIASYYPLPALGGIWSFVSQLKERLERLGHSVDILSHNLNATKYRIIGRKPELSISQITPHIDAKLKRILPQHSNQWIDKTEEYRYSLELSALYYGLNQYDIIHAQDVIAADALRRVKPKHIPLVTSAHGYLSGGIFYHLKTLHRNKTDEQIKQMFEYQYHNALEYEGYHASDYIHAPSKWSYNKIVNEFSVMPKKLFTFSDGMDIEGFLSRSKGESPISRPKDKKIILFTGRLVFLKGIQYLIEALAKLKLDRRDWECWILGEGAMQSELQGNCTRLGLTNEVKFLGVTNNVPHFLKQADIFVLPGLQDTQPHSLMEAQLIGLPAIVSDAAALPEMVSNGQNGLVFPAGNSQQLYIKLKYLLENDLIREQFSHHAKLWAHKRWSMDKMINNTLNFYHKAIRNNKNS
ncbi:glycosyltransferase family 4 protein [Brevibacterium sp. PAMC23299]|nr:glycosyltransferase family 4 protein [Brevibacterium sp. PAMC23299]